MTLEAIQNEQEIQPLLNKSPNASSDETLTSDDHKEVLKDTINSVKCTSILMLLTWTLQASRTYVWILYAYSLRKYHLHNELISSESIGIVLFLNYIAEAIGAIIISLLVIKYSFSYILLFAVVIICTGCCVEAVAEDFITLSN